MYFIYRSQAPKVFNTQMSCVSFFIFGCKDVSENNKILSILHLPIKCLSIYSFGLYTISWIWINGDDIISLVVVVRYIVYSQAGII